jgi:glucose/arabinose dehydrogenase
VRYDTRMRRLCPLLLAMLCVLRAGEAGAQLRSRVHASGFFQPIAFVQDPTDRNVQFVVQQDGRIRVVRNGSVLPTDFLNLANSIVSGGERGLLGLAFAPDYATSGRFYVNFTNPAGNTVVARFRRSGNPVVADAGSRFDLLLGGTQRFISQPYTNHKGGHIAFGPDDYLYIGLGDGGSGNDPEHRAQDPNELLGKMLRIDVNVPDSNTAGYAVPSSNPFVDRIPVAARAEIWAFGLRNPWRYNFDDPRRGGTGAMIIGDVGQGAFEEVDFEPRGAGGRNYGWRNREGAHNNVTSRPLAYQPAVDPIFEYNRTQGQSITGGFVYRGQALGAGFRGRYFFADFVSGRVWSFALDQSGEGRASDLRDHTAELGGSAVLGNVSSFGVDSDGELYVVGYSLGTILKIFGPAAAPPVPSSLRIIK